MNEDLLRDSLTHISDRATPVDFLDRSLSRSKRIARNRRLMGSATAAIVLALVGGIAWQIGQSGTPGHRPAGPASHASPSPSPSAPVTESIAGLPGWLYYVMGGTAGDQLARLTGDRLRAVLARDGSSAAVSPDGASIAFIDTRSSTVVVTDIDGAHPRTVLHNAFTGSPPAWSPDSRRLLVAKTATTWPTLGTVSVATGKFTPLAHQPHVTGPVWAPDGQHMGFVTPTGHVGVADIDGGNVRDVPVTDGANRAWSMSPDGSLLAVHRIVPGDRTNTEGGPSLFVANAVIDTRTGDSVVLPVTGSIIGVFFQPNGNILVRTTSTGGNTLTLLGRDRLVLAQSPEPATVNKLVLRAYSAP